MCCVNSWLFHDSRVFRIKSRHKIVLLEVKSFYKKLNLGTQIASDLL